MLEPKECLICLENVPVNIIFDWMIEGCDCRIKYHDMCIQTWNETYPQSCPLCRKQVRIYNMRYETADSAKFILIFLLCSLLIVIITLSFIYR